jgi:hypothetical protein
MSHAQHTQAVEFLGYRDPQAIFEAAIKRGVLSADESADNFAGNYMYMGDCHEGGAMFKHSLTRMYLPACKLEV